MNILISAYSCEPGKGSEPGVGWNVAREVAKYHNVWVLTRPDESGAIIDAELARNPVPNLHIVYFTLPFWQDSMRWGQSGAMQIHYYLWQIQAYFVARRLHRQVGFDLVHHVTFVRHSTPSFLSLLPIPFIWGPVGGGESAPKPFWKDFGLRAKVYETARAWFRGFGELDPFTRLTVRRSAVVRATTEDTARRLRKLGATQVQIISETGLPEEEMIRLSQYPLPPSTDSIKFISMGRLLHWKGFHLGIRAFAAAALPNAEYWLCGEGPERERLESLAAELGVGDRVKFFGRLPRQQSLEKLGKCIALVHPSLHDSGGWVCLEAMAASRPVICLNLGGPAVQVTDETGFKVAAETPEQAVTDLASAMRRMATDPDLRRQMGKTARQRVEQVFTWERVGRSLVQLYEETGGQSTVRSRIPVHIVSSGSPKQKTTPGNLKMDKKLLLVTFPVDFGNAGFEKRLINLFEGHLDLEVYRFVPGQFGAVSYKAMIRRRFLGAYGLWKAVRAAQKEGRKVLFHGISPALFAYPVTMRNSSYIITDWTRKLYEPIHGISLSPKWLTLIHQEVLKSQKYILGITNAIIEEIKEDYNVSQDKLKKAKLPFSADLKIFSPSPQRVDDEVRILFVGGDLYRKGGDVLIRWFNEQENPNLRLTIVTKSPIEDSSKISVEGNIEYGQDQHVELFKNHDIFVLPTMCDGYPSVLGEAACAGLAILTTKHALGAPEVIQQGVNGYICSSQEALLEQLSLLVKNKALLEIMKSKSREFMEKEFSSEIVLSEFVNYIFG